MVVLVLKIMNVLQCIVTVTWYVNHLVLKPLMVYSQMVATVRV